jgi:hypothetical protein
MREPINEPYIKKEGSLRSSEDDYIEIDARIRISDVKIRDLISG